METAVLTKSQIVTSLTRSTHGQLPPYQPITSAAAQREPEFLAHLIAWNHEKGAVRDSKIALPLYSLAEPAFPLGLAENSYAHLALLPPRDFVRALDAARTVGMAGKNRRLRSLVERYLRAREGSYGLWESAVVQHRASLKTLYARYHIAPGGEKNSVMDRALFQGKPPKGSTLDVIRQLPTMGTKEALGYCLQRKLPALIIIGALKDKIKGDVDAALALINSMTPSEVITNARMLEKLYPHPVVREAIRGAMLKAAETPRADTLLKAKRIAEHADKEVKTSRLGDTLRQVQQRQIQAHGGVKGRWLVIGDKSGSMQQTIQIARQVATHLAGFAEACHLVYVDQSPSWYKDVSGWTLARIEEETQYIRGEGGTQMSAGLAYIYQRGIEVDGICVVTDCEDGNPTGFVQAFRTYAQRFDREPTLYIFRCPGGHRNTLQPALEQAGIVSEVYDLGAGFDFYSLPNIIATLQTRKWGLLDQIMETPLRTTESVFAAYHA